MRKKNTNASATDLEMAGAIVAQSMLQGCPGHPCRPPTVFHSTVYRDSVQLTSLESEELPTAQDILWNAASPIMKRGSSLQQTTNPYQPTLKVRRFYSLCVLLFCPSSRCCMPMHLLLTDVVKQYGGSSS